jgi:hypothetical protein
MALTLQALAGAQAPGAPGIPDLSGDWFHPVVVSLSKVDPRAAMRGREPDIPYQPWAREKTMSEVSATGGDGRFEQNTDPYIHYCEPLGLVRMFGYPSKSRFIQTPEAVYILDEIGPTFRVVWLNATHPDDPDPQYWGHSIGRYENGDTLVVDTIGVNDRTWLDQVAHIHTDQMHLIERFTRVDLNTLAYEVTIDDPGAYTQPWGLRRNFTRSTTGFMRYQWACSVRETIEHYEKVGKAGNSGATTFK